MYLPCADFYPVENALLLQVAVVIDWKDAQGEINTTFIIFSVDLFVIHLTTVL